MTDRKTAAKAALGLGALSLGAGLMLTTSAGAHFIGVVGNNSIDGSLCVGFDCVAEEAFGFDTIRLKENNLRLQFDDTSAIGGFPTNNWQIRANSSSSGGANFLAFVDQNASGTSESGTLTFVVEADAGANALFVEDGGDVGINTGNPVVDLHIVSGNTPTVRLEQDGSNGFTPQTWDMAGNEANFFIRDATNGSTLPFRIRPGAGTSVIDIQDDERVGINTAGPDATMEIIGVAASLGANNAVLKLTNPAAAGPVSLQFASADTGTNLWNLTSSGNTNNFIVNRIDTAGNEFLLNSSGDLTILGTLTTGGPTCGGGCDAVFDPAVYTVPSIEEHAALMWENGYLPAVGPTGPDAPVNLTEHMGRMLNELEHAHIYIEALNERIKLLEARLAEKG